MQRRHTAAVATATMLFIILFLLHATTNALNITSTLMEYPEFSTFNRYLTITKLAPEINRRQTITICVVDNAAMDDLLSKNLSNGSIRNVLALHVLLDYFDAKKLHFIANGTALSATLFQATGSAPGTTGFVRVTDLKGGKVGFSPESSSSSSPAATFVKSVETQPYNYSVIQISAVLPSPEAEAPTPEPKQLNLTTALSAHGCKAFADALLATAADQTFEANIESGLTVFCPGDAAMKSFAPIFKNLTAEGKQSLLEYHAMPVYESLSGLRSTNGVSNTLATDGAKTFSLTVQNDGNDVTIKSPLVTATIVHTLIDQMPVAIYELDKVLMPKELFNSSSLPPSPSPSPAKPPKPSTSNHTSPPAPEEPADSPADAPESEADAADEHPKHKSGAVTLASARFGGVILSLCFAFLLI